MKRIILLLVFFLVASSLQSVWAQCGCTITVGATQYEVDGNKLGIKPGDVICIPAGNIGSKNFINIKGSPTNPVIIKNCGGKSYLERAQSGSFGFNFSKSRYFRVTGTGDPNHFYGFEINGTNQAVQVGDGSSDFEVDHFRIYNTGYAGLALKTNPTCDPATWRANFTMYNVKAHDNYFTNTKGESIYIGNSHYHSAATLTCNGVSTQVLEHAIINCEVYNNIVENSGRDGIQVASVISGGKIYNNLIDGFGLKDPEHIHGYAINPGFTGVVYNNIARNGVGFCIQSLGDGVVYYNNVLENCGRGGITVDDRGPTPGRSYIIANNTFIKNQRYGVYFLSQASVNNKFYNNIIVSDGSGTFKYTSKHPSANLEILNNITTTNISSVFFDDAPNKIYSYGTGSPAIDGGISVSAFGITTDIEGRPRPVNGKYDIGAYEEQGNVLQANAGVDVTVTIPTTTVTLNGSGSSPGSPITSYTWTKKSGGVATLVNANTPTLTVNGLAVGIYEFTLTVNNGTTTATDNVVVTVLPLILNQIPTVSAGSDKIITLPTSTVTINGTAADSDGSITKYTWTQTSGPAGAVLTNATTPTLTVTGLVQGLYQFKLAVEDNGGATAEDQILITVKAGATNTLPTVNAGADKTVSLPTNSLNLTGTATDPDGTISTLLWEKKSGPAATLANQNTLNLSLTGLVAGTYVFRLTATDNAAGQAFDEVTVIVQSGNQNPTANAGADKTITLPTATQVFSGSGTDPDGSIASYLWTQVSGAATTLTNSTTPTLTITLGSATAGDYVFGLTVTDNAGATAYDEVKLTVLAAPVNKAPTVNGGSDQSMKLPTNSATLTATASDPDGSIASYAWTKKNGPSATLTNETTKTLTLADLVAGNYVFTITVTDNQGLQASDEVSVTVLPADVNQSPVANAGGNKFITLPDNSILLTGVGADPDGTVSGYAWTQISGNPVTLSGANTQTLDITGLTEGTYVFRFTITDDKGATASDDMQLIVGSVNLTPKVNAGTDRIIVLPTNTDELNGTAVDEDGTIVTLQWTKISGPSFTISGDQSLIASLSNLVEGVYVFELTATDNDGATGSDQVTLTVINSTINQFPVAQAGPDQVIFLPTNTLVLSGAASDPDGTITTYQWTQVGATTATLVDDNTANLTATNLVAGSYTFRLTVTDNDGATAFDEVKVTVNPATSNILPLVSAGGNIILQLPTNQALLTGSASDNDGSITSYSWTKVSGPAATLTNGNTAALQISGLIEGIYVFRLTVTDNSGGTSFAEARVTVFPANVNKTPVANAGANQVLLLPVNSTTLVGSGSDEDGTVVSYLWTKVSGPALTLGTASNQITEISGLVEGVYILKLTVTDDKGATGTDEIQITVNAVASNLPPIADAGGAQTLTLPTNTINLIGSGADLDGSVVSYQWTKITGGTATLINPTTPVLTLDNLVAGTYQFRLRVTDNSGATGDDFASVLVNSATTNLPPVANAGADKVLVLPNSTITLLGEASDNDGAIVSYQWTQVVGPVSTINNADKPSAVVSGLGEGLYTYRLTVTDDNGTTDFDEVTIRVLPENSNIIPVVNAGTDVVIYLPTSTVTLAPTLNDPDGSISTILWTKISGPAATLVNPAAANLQVNNLVQGTYIFQVTGIDNNNASASDQVKVTVVPAVVNQPPVVNAGADVTITLPANSTTLTGTATDNGSIVSTLWTKLSGPAATLTGTGTLTLGLSNLVVGTYEFELRATDDQGAIDADKVLVIVKPVPPNQPPIADAGENIDLLLPQTAPIVLTGSGVDNDGSIISYSWAQISGPAVTLQNALTSTLTVSNITTENLYTFRITVTDNTGATDTDDVLVFAYVDNAVDRKPPIALAGLDTVVLLPVDSVYIVGSGDDPDGTVESFLWKQISGPSITMDAPDNRLILKDLIKGEYLFELTVTDNDSLSSTDEFTLVITSQGLGMLIPRYFSPNNDGQNDTWVIKNVEAIAGCPLDIYSRDGRQVYTNPSYDNSWDGTSKEGRTLIDGDYYYVIRCKGDVVTSGGVRIIR